MEPSKKPLNVLIKEMNAHIRIVLKNGIEYRGTMIHCDNYMKLWSSPPQRQQHTIHRSASST